MTEPRLNRVLAAIDRRAAATIRRARARRAAPVQVDHVTLTSTVGYRLDAWVHRLADAPTAPAPAAVLCPGIDDPAAIFDSWRGPLHADEVARLGYVALRFDPAGRGASWGEEDMGGPEHQDNVATMVGYLRGRPEVDPERVGVVAISFGVAMAAGAIADHGAKAAWLLDWEGPSDREIITVGGTIAAPTLGHAIDDEVYWRPREPARQVSRLGCGYVRLQAEFDHAQGVEIRHATRMVQAAHDGDVAWFQINDHPRNELPPRPVWLPRGELAANRAILQKLRSLMHQRREADQSGRPPSAGDTPAA